MNIPNGKCPTCGKVVNHVTIDRITAGDKIVGPLHKAVSLKCQSCKTVLGVSFDPEAARQGIVDKLLEALGRGHKG